MQAGWIPPARILAVPINLPNSASDQAALLTTRESFWGGPGPIPSVSRDLCQSGTAWIEAPWPDIWLWITAPGHKALPGRYSEACSPPASFPWEALLGPEHAFSRNKCKQGEKVASHLLPARFCLALRCKHLIPTLVGRYRGKHVLQSQERFVLYQCT